MDMLSGAKITAANLADWRKLGQGLHARFLVDDFRAGVHFRTAINEACTPVVDHLEVRMGHRYVDLVAEQRIAAAVAAGAIIVDDSRAPWTTVIADADGNKACVGTFQPAPEAAASTPAER